MLALLHTALLSLFFTILVSGTSSAVVKRMTPAHNVGGYVDVGPTADYVFQPSPIPSELPVASEQARNQFLQNGFQKNLQDYLKTYPATTAILVVEAGQILYEAYQGVGSEVSEFYSMSIGKSLTSLAAGQAVCGGLIPSLDQSANMVVPEFGETSFGRSTVRHLLTMSSGAYQSVRSGQPKFTGGIGSNPRTGKPFNGYSWPIRLGQVTVSDILWGPLWERIENKNVHSPGEMFIYKGADTLAISTIVERRTGKPLAAYFDQMIWQKTGPEGPAHWEADRNGATMASSGFQARLKDWGRLAVWILKERKQNTCFGEYLRKATSTQITLPSTLKTSFRGYGYQWWTDNKRAPGFWGLGYAGQMLALNPETDKIMIKFSYRQDSGSGIQFMSIFDRWNKL
ncbi:serine hydrolase domain-containing protein [Sneathiella sp.]|jgi:CubicO group peptidase (beta-lactamase class C family)|uniref:serine hydrolase domain-containing protein n=1 Tax=Sneathiella sp. TaxID=1964365 RepID=UPI0039E39B58